MRNIFGVLLVVIIGFTSCEGRKSYSQALNESIDEFKESVSLEINVFIPETYVERDVDTTLSNGYHVKIKTYTDEANNVLFSKIKDTINYQTYYRNYKFDISILKYGKIIYSQHFNKQRINKDFRYKSNVLSGSLLHNFDKLAVLKSIQVNEDTTLKNIVEIDILYAIPESERYASHTLFIDEKGKSNIVQIEIK
jgi:hypothetical protein